MSKSVLKVVHMPLKMSLRTHIKSNPQQLELLVQERGAATLAFGLLASSDASK